MPHDKPTVALADAPENLEQTPASRPKIGFVSLGCPKNLVDSEVMMGMLAEAGAELISSADDADVIVVNTCSFIASAQQESVNTILEMARHKTDGRARKLIVAGCLVERFRDEIRKNIPEVDAVVGTGELEKILAAAGVATPSPEAFTLQHSELAPRRRRSRGKRPVFPRVMGRCHRRLAQLSLRRSHTSRPGDSEIHRVH